MLIKLITFLALTGMIFTTKAGLVSAQQSVQSNKVITRVGEAAEGQKPGGASTQPAVDNKDFVYFTQLDPKWANYCALGAAGCGPTSMAMIFSTILKEIKTPAEMDDLFRSQTPIGRFCGDFPSTIPNVLISQWFRQRFEARPIKVDYSSGTWDLSEGSEYLEAGWLLLASTSSHIFVIDQIDTKINSVHIQDPIQQFHTPSYWTNDPALPVAGGQNATPFRPWKLLRGNWEPMYYVIAIKKL